MKFRHPLITFIEVFIPCLCIVLLFQFHDGSHDKSKPTEIIYKPYNIDYVPNRNWTLKHVMSVFYTPKSMFLDKVMDDITKKLNLTFSGFETEEQLVEAYLNSTSDVIVTGIVFSESLIHGLNRTRKIKFKIRPETEPGFSWQINHIFPPMLVQGPLEKTSVWGTNYMTLGFLPLQHAIAMSFMENLYANSTRSVEEMFYVQMQRFPEPPHVQYGFYYKPEFIFVILVCIGFLLPFANLTKDVVNEKEKHLKETLKVMGVASWMNSAAWYFSSLFYFGLLCAIITVMLCTQFTNNQAVFHYSNSFLIFLCLFCYSSCLISSCLFLSALFYSKTAAMCGAFIGFFLSLMPYMHMVLAEQKMSRFALVIFCLFPNAVLGYGVGIWIKVEEMGIGLQKENLGVTGSVSLQLSMKDVLFIFLGDTVFFFLLAWYIGTIFPGKYLEGQPWYFPVTGLYWTGNKKPKTEVIQSFGMHELKPEYFEKEPYGVRPTIEFKHLTKTFRKGSKPAVKNLFLKAYRNQITVLLGHDGSGKSTAVSILLKKCHPTSGKAFIKGCNVSIESESRKIPRFLGFCPDHDICFDHLSVEENLYFYCKMKDFESEGLSSQIDHIMGVLDLELKRKTVAGNLSAGWKRKLSVGIALIGESEVVVIDNPTSHMDSYSRRIVWEALKAEKVFRTIFVATSYMEEADAIGDRMGIIDEGELQSFGSTSFVKNLYGAGYHLVIEKDDTCKIANVTNLIKNHIPGSKLHSSNGTLKYVLPLDKAPLLQFLLTELEDKKDSLKISNYSVSQITMKELFDRVSLKASAGSYVLPEFAREALDDFTGAGEDSLNTLFVKERNEGLVLILQQAVAIWKKKFLFSIRHILLFLSQILILPLIFIVSNTFTTDEIIPDNPLHLNLELLNVSDKPIEVQYSVNPSNKQSRELSNAFASLFKSPNGAYLLDSREETLNEHLLDLAEENPLEYHKNYFLAADFYYNGNNNIITAFYHNKALHSPPLSLLYVHNAILKYMTKDDPGLFFEVINHPLPIKNLRMAMVKKTDSLLPSFLIAQDLMFSISIVMAGFIVPLVWERSKQFKKLQFLTGLSRFFYWILTFLYDFSTYIMACALLLLILNITGLYGCSQQQQLGRVILLLLIHGIVGLLFVYCCSCFARSSSAGYICVFLYHMLGLVIQFSFAMLANNISRNTYENVDYLFSFFLPCYAFVQGFLNLYENWLNNQACNNQRISIACERSGNSTDYFELRCCKERCGNNCYWWEDNFFSWRSPGIGKHTVFPFVQIAIFITIIILFEHKVFSVLKLKILDTLLIKKEQTSEGEMREAESISSENLLRSNECLVVREVTKYFRRKCVLDNLMFSVSRGETFGLVGRKDAGKTTIMDIITGDLLLSRGQVYLNGKDNTKAERRIGFCPEISALLGFLTGEETLLLFANMRGIPQPQILNCVYHLSKLLDLDHVLKQMVKDCNSCAKRKLSVAISLLGAPPLIILDEPTKKMDPTSCRSVWKALLQASNVGCTILLATQRMDECEAACNRIGILANGVLVYTGNLAELKRKYEGYTLHLELMHKSLTSRAMTSRSNAEEAKIWIEGWFPEAILKADLPNSLYYYIPHRDIKWSVFFRMMEKAKRQNQIYHYFINGTSLEQILFFATTVSTVKEKMITEYLKERMK
ncbi:ATP-binding cassette sub-family A member 3 [Araneus ventricosus]|uniref:ATP-binding cassette sub-family A member 3 n=1 Tax=Araneus ventricosus TaxID=182803 RepID=A0A4Y2JI91_ARAVE|nr:ATP-binding cassette sub-family A member 3 [Araneus ventricosus]